MGSGVQRKAAAGLTGLLAGEKAKGCPSGPQNFCLQGWSTHSTPECLEGKEQTLKHDEGQKGSVY